MISTNNKETDIQNSNETFDQYETVQDSSNPG